jgi:DNA/RNA endonuclease YhcR with UshA esterase domain
MTNQLTGARRLALAAALAAGLTACEHDPAPPFEIEGTGAVEGLFFFDRNEDGRFDPSDGDYLLGDLPVEIRERGTNRVLAQGAFRTDASGRFRVEGLPAGTHDVFITESALPAGTVLCTNPVRLTIVPQETQFLALQARGGCLVLISVAESQPAGTDVVVRGVVTSFPGQLRGSYTYIQDASGGIRIFSSALENQGIQIGDRIEVSGRLGIFNNDLQLGNPVVLRNREPNFGPVAPQTTTTGALRAAAPQATARLQGMLVRAQRARVTSGFGTRGANERNGWIDDGTGEIQVRFETAVVSGSGTTLVATLNQLMTVDKCYNVTGVIGNFTGTAQIFPRSTADVTEVPCS